MLNTANAPSKPTTPPTTNPTRRATTARLFSFNTYLPDTLVHYAPECVEGKFCEVRLERRPGPRCFLHFGAAVRLLLVGWEFPWLLAPALALPRPDPLKRVWEGSLRPSDIMANADICLRQGSIRDRAYLSIDVTSSSGAGLCGAPGGVILGVSGWGYAASWI